MTSPRSPSGPLPLGKAFVLLLALTVASVAAAQGLRMLRLSAGERDCAVGRCETPLRLRLDAQTPPLCMSPCGPPGTLNCPPGQGEMCGGTCGDESCCQCDPTSPSCAHNGEWCDADEDCCDGMTCENGLCTAGACSCHQFDYAREVCEGHNDEFCDWDDEFMCIGVLPEQPFSGQPCASSCVAAGGACTSTSQCCAGNTCVGSASPPPPSCAPELGHCNEDADCCGGLICQAGGCMEPPVFPMPSGFGGCDKHRTDCVQDPAVNACAIEFEPNEACPALGCPCNPDGETYVQCGAGTGGDVDMGNVFPAGSGLPAACNCPPGKRCHFVVKNNQASPYVPTCNVSCGTDDITGIWSGIGVNPECRCGGSCGNGVIDSGEYCDPNGTEPDLCPPSATGDTCINNCSVCVFPSAGICTPACIPIGAACTSPGQCCGGACTAGVCVPPTSPVYTIAVTDGRTTITPGQATSYVVSIMNVSTVVPIVPIQVTFGVPPQMDPATVVPSAGGVFNPLTGLVTWSGIVVPPGLGPPLSVNATVKPTAAPGVITAIAQIIAGPSGSDNTTIPAQPPPPTGCIDIQKQFVWNGPVGTMPAGIQYIINPAPAAGPGFLDPLPGGGAPTFQAPIPGGSPSTGTTGLNVWAPVKNFFAQLLDPILGGGGAPPAPTFPMLVVGNAVGNWSGCGFASGNYTVTETVPPGWTNPNPTRIVSVTPTVPGTAIFVNTQNALAPAFSLTLLPSAPVIQWRGAPVTLTATLWNTMPGSVSAPGILTVALPVGSPLAIDPASVGDGVLVGTSVQWLVGALPGSALPIPASSFTRSITVSLAAPRPDGTLLSPAAVATAPGAFAAAALTVVNPPPQVGCLTVHKDFVDWQGNALPPALQPRPTFRVTPGGLSAVADASGNAVFNGLTPGAYSVAEDPMPGWTQVTPARGMPATAIVPAGGCIGASFVNEQDPPQPTFTVALRTPAPPSGTPGTEVTLTADVQNTSAVNGSPLVTFTLPAGLTYVIGSGPLVSTPPILAGATVPVTIRATIDPGTPPGFLPVTVSAAGPVGLPASDTKNVAVTAPPPDTGCIQIQKTAQQWNGAPWSGPLPQFQYQIEYIAVGTRPRPFLVQGDALGSWSQCGLALGDYVISEVLPSGWNQEISPDLNVNNRDGSITVRVAPAPAIAVARFTNRQQPPSPVYQVTLVPSAASILLQSLPGSQAVTLTAVVTNTAPAGAPAGTPINMVLNLPASLTIVPGTITSSAAGVVGASVAAGVQWTGITLAGGASFTGKVNVVLTQDLPAGTALTPQAVVPGDSASTTLSVVQPPPAMGCIEVRKLFVDWDNKTIIPDPLPPFTFTLDGGIQATTNASGFALFPPVAPGSHTVTEVQQKPAWTQVLPEDEAAEIVIVTPGACKQVTFTNRQKKPDPEYTIALTALPTPVPPGGTVTLRATVQNVSAVSGTPTITFTLPPELAYIPGPVLLVHTLPVPLPAGAAAALTIQAKVAAGTPDGTVLTSQAQVGAAVASASVTVQTPAATFGCLTIKKEIPGKVANTWIPAAAPFGFGVTAPGFTDGGSTTTLGEFTLINLIPRQYTVTEDAVSGWQPDGATVQKPTVSPGSNCAVVTFRNKPDSSEPSITISITDKRTTAPPGQLLDYEITVTNVSAVVASNVIIRTDVLDPVLLVPAAVGGTVTAVPPRIGQWTIPSLPPGPPVVLHLTAKIDGAALDGKQIDTKAIVASVNGSPTGAPSATDTTVVEAATTPGTGCIRIVKHTYPSTCKFSDPPTSVELAACVEVSPVPTAYFVLNGNMDAVYKTNSKANVVISKLDPGTPKVPNTYVVSELFPLGVPNGVSYVYQLPPGPVTVRPGGTCTVINVIDTIGPNPPPPPGRKCGDRICQDFCPVGEPSCVIETCNNCPADCGHCAPPPPEPGSITVEKTFFNDKTPPRPLPKGNLPPITFRLMPGGITKQTDASGKAKFSPVNPGTYTITELPSEGWKQTKPGGPASVTVAAGQDVIVPFENSPIIYLRCKRNVRPGTAPSVDPNQPTPPGQSPNMCEPFAPAMQPNKGYLVYSTIMFDVSQMKECNDLCSTINDYVACWDPIERKCIFGPNWECKSNQLMTFPIFDDGSSDCTTVGPLLNP